ncbi:sigma-70 family RNA polymerase sigma factor [Flocculibacter collagenilyticus]|uniref:sigma-70 family RNA polymerase sigma factor n=1 Tax=Flocculibacter collagenilyticus TaxID=2744479 RepID=UPI001F225E14|nr:sigma-70 family RNA polymerase sigma factor [Flocculibacter collagenilyticus]
MAISLGLKQWLLPEASNEQLMGKYSETGEVKWLEQLVERCGDDLFHFITSQTDRDMAKDICQLTWLKVIDNRSIYSQSGSFKAWLFQISRYLLIDEMRRQRRWHMEELNEHITEQQALLSVEINVNESKSIQAAFNKALETLPFLQREAFILQQEGFSLRDIAKITSAEMETVKSRLRYAKGQLKKQLTSLDLKEL